jgi:hypothetical protein
MMHKEEEEGREKEDLKLKVEFSVNTCGFFFFSNVSVRVSLRAPRPISQALKLTTM